jgi:Protein of unknown function (DUF1553)/Protein of unknown function (DUF1549)/Planctomycete cytochrome C
VRHCWIALVVGVFLQAGIASAGGATSPVRFGRDVLPILSENCFKCHGPDEKARKAKLRLDQRGGMLSVVTPGKGDESELVRRIESDDPEEQMPPQKSGRSLTAGQKEVLRRWIDQGAAWGKHWAYEALVRPSLPATKDTAWPRNPIDYFVLEQLEKEGLRPSPQACKETLIRRVTLDLTGLPPTLREVDAFLADHSPDAYEKVVDRLLASDHYGERMALEWLDDARYADTNGYQNDFARNMWPWRDWVISAFNRNMPFDEFVIEQIAGDMLPGATLQQRVASGFNRNNRTVTEAGSIDDEWRVENNVDRVETTATVFLGLTMGCARCHEHKYDPISQKEFYEFFAFFNSINEKGVYTEQPGNVPPMVALPTQAEQRRLDEFDGAIMRADRAVQSHAEKEVIAQLFHAPFAPAWLEAVANAAGMRHEKSEYEKRISTVMVMEELSKPRATYVLKRGQYDHPDRSQKVEPNVPAFLPPLPGAAPHNRLGLSRWLVDPANPLTARVTVNRYWQRYFGTGMVKTTENFGIQGEPPSHPELLDWLATEFIRMRWDVKAMQRLIVTSAAYRQSSKVSPELAQRDPENRLLARGPRFRLPAELVRDNALAIGGLLMDAIGGRSIKPYQPAGLWEELAGGAGEGPYVQDKGPNLYRRSLYIYRKRTVPHPELVTFDAPSREICQVKRARTNTPLQALELLNDVTYVEAARKLAEIMLRERGVTPADRIRLAFRRATARLPRPDELDLLVSGLTRYKASFDSDEDAANRFIRHGDSPTVTKTTAAELAAYTATASVILNLDETVTKE